MRRVGDAGFCAPVRILAGEREFGDVGEVLGELACGDVSPFPSPSHTLNLGYVLSSY